MPRRRVANRQTAVLRSNVIFENTTLALLQAEIINADDFGGLMRNTTNDDLYRIVGTTGAVPSLLPVLAALEGNAALLVTNAIGDRLLVLGEGPLVLVQHAAAARLITLPAAPVEGTTFTIADVTGNSDTDNITVGRNGKNINGAGADFVFDRDFAAVKFVFSTALDAWVTTAVFNALVSSVPTGGV